MANVKRSLNPYCVATLIVFDIRIFIPVSHYPAYTPEKKYKDPMSMISGYKSASYTFYHCLILILQLNLMILLLNRDLKFFPNL